MPCKVCIFYMEVVMSTDFTYSDQVISQGKELTVKKGEVATNITVTAGGNLFIASGGKLTNADPENSSVSGSKSSSRPTFGYIVSQGEINGLTVGGYGKLTCKGGGTAENIEIK